MGTKMGRIIRLIKQASNNFFMPIFLGIFIGLLFLFFYDPAVVSLCLCLAFALWLVVILPNKKNVTISGKKIPVALIKKICLVLGFALIIFMLVYQQADLYDGGWKDAIRSRFYAIKYLFSLKTNGYFLLTACYLLSLKLIKRKKYFFAGWVLLLCFFIVATYQSVFDYLQNTGDEALLELQHFNLHDASALMSSLSGNINFSFNIIGIILAIGFAHILITAKEYVKQHHAAGKLYFNIFYFLLMGLLIYQPLDRLYNRSIMSFINNRNFVKNTQHQYGNNLPPMSFTRQGLRQGLQMVVYIGESTSPLHWSLYGYYRPTTAQLEKLSSRGNLLVFHNVFSTHSHTTPSLLNVLSFRPTAQNIFTPIEGQQRIPLVSLLTKSNITNHYISAQTAGLAIDALSLSMFQNINHFNNTNSKDHLFLLPALKKISKDFRDNNNNVVWLHSYAGHTPYLRYLAFDFAKSVDDTLSAQPITNITKDSKKKSLINDINNYDSVMTYIDDNLAKAIDQLANNPLPIIFIYFSDHGESPTYGLGHDSSRFRHEMLRVPFVIYFNQAAKLSYPDLWQKYQGLAKDSQKNISLLNQLPYTMVDLFGGNMDRYGNAIVIKPVMGQKNNSLEPVLVRNTPQGLTYVNLNLVPFANAPTASINRIDPDTKIYLENINGGKKCYDVIDIRTAAFGSFIAPCLTIDKQLPNTNPLLFTAIKKIANKQGVEVR